jgi:hypothetical protein
VADRSAQGCFAESALKSLNRSSNLHLVVHRRQERQALAENGVKAFAFEWGCTSADVAEQPENIPDNRRHVLYWAIGATLT